MNDPQILSGSSDVKFGSEYCCGCH